MSPATQLDMSNESPSNDHELDKSGSQGVLSEYAETIGSAVGSVAKQVASFKEQGAHAVEQLSALVKDPQPALDQLGRRVEDQLKTLRGHRSAVPVQPLQPAPLSKRQRRKRAVMSPEAMARLGAKEEKRQEKWRKKNAK